MCCRRHLSLFFLLLTLSTEVFCPVPVPKVRHYLRQLDEGSNGVVWTADLVDGRRVAIKFAKKGIGESHLNENEEALSRFTLLTPPFLGRTSLIRPGGKDPESALVTSFVKGQDLAAIVGDYVDHQVEIPALSREAVLDFQQRVIRHIREDGQFPRDAHSLNLRFGSVDGGHSRLYFVDPSFVTVQAVSQGHNAAIFEFAFTSAAALAGLSPEEIRGSVEQIRGALVDSFRARTGSTESDKLIKDQIFGDFRPRDRIDWMRGSSEPTLLQRLRKACRWAYSSIANP